MGGLFVGVCGGLCVDVSSMSMSMFVSFHMSFFVICCSFVSCVAVSLGMVCKHDV